MNQQTAQNLRPIFLTAEWRDLLVANYDADPEILQPFIPKGTELDLWQGRTILSVVAFRFLNTKVMGIAIPFHVNFEEVNLRFYVKREVDGEIRRGVVFIKELVPRYAIALVARAIYNEKYYSVPMSHSINTSGDKRELRFGWCDKRRQHSIYAETYGTTSVLEPDSEAEFIFEHYWGYSKSRRGETTEYRVAHPRWKAWKTAELKTEIDFDSVYGTEFGKFLKQPPCSSFVADGSHVTVHKGERILC